jgi:putative transposase
MKVRKAFKYKLKTNTASFVKLAQFAGSNRFVFNRALALIKYNLDNKTGYQNYNALADELTYWKQFKETSFLNDIPSQTLQQTLKDLDRACKDAFKKIRNFPKFKKKGQHDSFRYPQGIKVKGEKVFLPKLGWMRFVKSREIVGQIKNATVSRRGDNWYISFQTEYDINVVNRKLTNPLGIDLGVKKFAYFSNNKAINPINSFKNLAKKLAKEQRKLAGKIKFSNNWKKQKAVITKLHIKIADVRKDFQHKHSTDISKNHALVVIEDLKILNMSKSAKGSTKKHGKNVKAKSGLNRVILDQGWYEFRRQIEYKQEFSGGKLILVNPKNTSRKCSCCGHINKDNRKSQAVFKCVVCGHKDHADHNAAKNILEAGLTSLACRDIKRIAA